MTNKISRVFLVVGIVLIAFALVLLLITRIAIPNNKEKAEDITEKLFNLMPEIKNGFPDGKGDTVMPSVELDGVDFCGVLEISAFDVCLPIANKWISNNVSKYPHRLNGSVYDNSLIVGGSDNDGQFDFMKSISIGDFVFFTDTVGVRYSYIVADIVITDDVSFDSLSGGEWDMTFFARNSYGFDYTVVKCKLK